VTTELHREVVGLAATEEPIGRSDLPELFRTHRVSLVRLAHLITGSVAVAEDVVQDAFLNLQRHRSTVRNPEAYLRRSVINGSRGFHRRRAIESRHRADGVVPIELPPELDEMWELLRRLPGRKRAVLVLRFYEDLSVGEIASLLDVREGTVRSLLHRSLSSLREKLDHE
jgi:RNA polymerase sigma factor (sigma-70 family)